MIKRLVRRWLGLDAPQPLPTLTPRPLNVSAMAVAESGATSRESPFRMPKPPPGVVPSGMAMDDAYTATGLNAWAMSQIWGEGIQFMGYPYLAELTQRPEYRRISETIAMEMTRKWVELISTGADDKQPLIDLIEKAMNKLHVRDAFRKAAEQDGFFGRSQIYLDTDVDADPDKLKTPLIVDRRTVKVGALKRLTVIEPMWVYPGVFNSSDPMAPDYFKPTVWYIMGKTVHASRLLTFVSREVPDILKPAYSFGGLSMSQMAKPYVDNWLRTRQSVSDITHAYSTPVLATNLEGVLSGGQGQQMINRAQLFNQTRDNRGLMMVDKDTEEFSNVSTPLSELSMLQAQSQEHMAAVSGIPLTILLGITPSGLNASSEGEIRTFYAWIEAQQENIFRDPLQKVLELVQLSEFGAIDPDIGFQFVPLWTMSEKEAAEINKLEAETDVVYMDGGVISPQEVRTRIAKQENSQYAGLDLSIEADAELEAKEEPDPFGNPGDPDGLDNQQGGE